MQTRFYFFMAITAGLVIMTNSCQTAVPEKQKADVNLTEDTGTLPYVLDIEATTLSNENYRTVHWTGENIQLVFMTLKPGEVINLEMHKGHDQFLRIEQGEARVFMGKTADSLSFDKKVSAHWAILVPSGYWHKVENIGSGELKLYSIYGPVEHAKGKIHKTYQEAEEED